MIFPIQAYYWYALSNESSSQPDKSFLLLESGGKLLLENGGGILLENSTPVFDGSMWIKFDSTLNATFAAGNRAPNAVQSAYITDGWLDLGHSAASYVQYEGALNVDSPQTGEVRFTVKTVYDSAPTGSEYLLFIGNTSENISSIIQLMHISSGYLLLYVADSVGNLIVQAYLGIWNPVAGQSYKFKLQYDFGSGNTRLLIDDNPFGAVITNQLTRSTVNALRFGKGLYLDSQLTHIFVKDFKFYPTIQ